jgi:hypothetical protein
MLACWYWILKTKAQFLSGDYAEALAAADKAKALLWTAFGETMLLDYFYYTALTVAATYEKASADQQQEWRDPKVRRHKWNPLVALFIQPMEVESTAVAAETLNARVPLRYRQQPKLAILGAQSFDES